MKKYYSILFLLFGCISVAFSQIQVSAPQKVAVGEQFRLQYTIPTTDVKGFRTGNIPDAFEVLMGPSTSTQQSFRMVGGHTTSSSSVTYTYILSAIKNGTFTIPAAKAKVEGNDVTSSAVKITVSGKASSSNPQQGGQMQQRGAQVRPSGSSISGNDLFIKVSANKQRVHEQEPILLTYKVYTQVELTQLEGKMPDLTGFHTQEVQLPQQKSFHIETINGKPYRCVTWSQYIMYPQITGKLEIPSIIFKGIVVQENTNVDPFEAFFNGGSGYVEVKKEIKAPGMTIQVDPLPAKPSDFSGGVGRFTISATSDKKSVKAGDPIKVSVVVSGNGNLKLIKQPEITVPKDFEKYEPKVTDKTQLTSQGLSGSMVYDILVVPRNQGDFQIPPIEFTYFDTSENKYKTTKTSPIDIHVDKGDGRTGDVTDYSQKEDLDIHKIMEGDISSTDVRHTFFGSVGYLLINAFIIIAFIVLLVVFRKRAMEMANLTAVRGKKANKVASKKLKHAASLMSKGKSSEFYDEVLRALWGYVSDKLSIPVSELSRENISDQLTTRNVESSVLNSFIEALDECEFERYAPGDAEGNMQKTYDKAVSAITNIEEGMKKKHSVSMHAISLFLLLSLSLSATAADVKLDDKENKTTENKATADETYSRGNYQQAIRIYESLLENNQSAEVYYNLGNAYYRSDNVTKAVINYERAMLLMPGNEDIKHNLTVARSKTIDKIQPADEVFITLWYDSLLGMMTVDSWAKTALFSLIAALLLLLTYLFVENITIRRFSFYSSTVLVLVFIFANLFAWQIKSNAENYDGAIVIAPVVNVKKTPTNDAADAFIIHEGTHVDIIDGSLKGWSQVKVFDGREGWISSNSIEKVVRK